MEGAKVELVQVFDMDVVETFALVYDAMAIGERFDFGFRAFPCRVL
jgi:hypothetical protein